MRFLLIIMGVFAAIVCAEKSAKAEQNYPWCINKSTASFSLFFVLSGIALVHAQTPPAPTETPSRLSLFVHDFTTWLDHVGGTRANHSRVVNHSPPPLPRPRLAERVSGAVASNKEFAPTPVAPKKETLTPIQIRD